MTTNYVEFEDGRASRDDRLYDAGTMLDRVAAFFAEDGYTEQDWTDRIVEAWERATESDS